jgi:hypothetical protein
LSVLSENKREQKKGEEINNPVDESIQKYESLQGFSVSQAFKIPSKRDAVIQTVKDDKQTKKTPSTFTDRGSTNIHWTFLLDISRNDGDDKPTIFR